MTIKAIMAMDKNGTIGNGIELPWKGDVNTKWDMDNFKKLTTNHIVMMGYNTFKGFKKPLKNRLNLVLSRPDRIGPNEVFYSLKDMKSVPNDLDIYSELIQDTEKYEYYTNLDNAKVIKNKDDLKDFLGKYWALCEHMESVKDNNSNEQSNKVNMMEPSLEYLYSYIPVDETDKRFVFTDIGKFLHFAAKEMEGKTVTGKDELARLTENYKTIKSVETKGYNKDKVPEEIHQKICNFDPSTAYIIGGAKTYEQLIGFIDEFIITEFNNEYEGDIKFNKDLLLKFSKSEVLEEHPNGKIVRYYN